MPIEGEYEPSAHDWVRDQVAEYEASGGQRANTLRDTGIPIIVVTMRGRTSGKVRKIGLMRVEHDGEVRADRLVRRPAGQSGLGTTTSLADPQVTIQDGPEPHSYVVREVFGDERDEWFQRGVAVFPTYADYQAKTERVIPVLVATPSG